MNPTTTPAPPAPPATVVYFDEAVTRNPARIDQTLAAIGAYWHANPNLRLCEVLNNALEEVFPRTGGMSSHVREEVRVIEDEILTAHVMSMHSRAIRSSVRQQQEKTLLTLWHDVMEATNHGKPSYSAFYCLAIKRYGWTMEEFHAFSKNMNLTRE